MDKKIVTARIKDMSNESRVKLLQLYKYAYNNNATDVVLFSNGVLGSENSLFDLVSSIPRVDDSISTCLFLGTEDIYSLSPSAFSSALKDRSDINVNLNGFCLINVGNKKINFFNDISQYEMCEDDIKGVYSIENINVYASRGNHGNDKATFLSGHNKIFVGPDMASLFEERDGAVVYSDLKTVSEGFELSSEQVVFSKGKEYTKTK